jgi:competence protein ComEC
MAGIAGGSSLVLPFAPVFVLLAVVLLALVCGRWPVAQSVLIGGSFVALGVTLVRWQREEPLKGQTLEAVVMSELAERPKTVGVDLLVPEKGRTMRCYLWKDSRSMNLKLGEGIKVRLSERQGSENGDHLTPFVFVKSRDWQPGGTALQRLSPLQRTRLFFLRLRHRLLVRYQALLFHEPDETHKSHAPDEDVYGVLAAMTLGDKSALTPDIRDTYNNSGVSHILALSGLHVGIIYMLLTWLTLHRQRFWLSQVLIVTGVWAFAFLTGLSPSVMRSAMMISLYALFATRSHGRAASLNVLAFAAIVMLIADARALTDLSFQLSFTAVFAILLFMPLFEQLWQPRLRPIRWLWGMATVSVAAQLGTAPLIAYYFGRLSTWFLLANFIVIPAAMAIVYGALFALLFPPVGQLLVCIVRLLNHALSYIAALPYASIDGLHPSALQVALIYIFIVLFYLIARILFPIIGGPCVDKP